jgi:DNA processing protein
MTDDHRPADHRPDATAHGPGPGADLEGAPDRGPGPAAHDSDLADHGPGPTAPGGEPADQGLDSADRPPERRGGVSAVRAVPGAAVAVDEVRLARVMLARLVEPGHRELGELVRAEGPVGAWERVRAGAVSPELHAAVRSRLHTGDPLDRAADDLHRTARLGARLVIPEDAEWPAALEPLTGISTADDPHVYPPLCLWVRGAAQLDEACARAVAVVGARAATPYGDHVSGEFGYGLADRGWTVISGGAYGIDGAAHRGALAAGGLTMAVLACGVDTVYPVGHGSLFDRIAEVGLLVSEWPPGATPQRHRFLVRNRVIAALGAGTVVVEAAARSGARMTARRAYELGRVVMAVPGPVTSAMSVGPHRLVREFGARLVASSTHVIEEVGRLGEALAEPAPDSADGPARRRDALEPRAARVLDAVPLSRPAAVERIAASAGLPARDVRRTLPNLVLLDLVEEVGTGYRVAAGARSALRTRPPTAIPEVR